MHLSHVTPLIEFISSKQPFSPLKGMFLPSVSYKSLILGHSLLLGLVHDTEAVSCNVILIFSY